MISSKNTTDPPNKTFESPKSIITGDDVKLKIENHPGHSKVPERNISPVFDDSSLVGSITTMPPVSSVFPTSETVPKTSDETTWITLNQVRPKSRGRTLGKNGLVDSDNFFR